MPVFRVSMKMFSIEAGLQANKHSGEKVINCSIFI